MIVGPTVSGKTKCYETLGRALTKLEGTMAVSGELYQAVDTYVLNPKSITMGQLYGEFDLMTHEWTDGILSTLIRQGCAATDGHKKWFMFDGPVDAVWIENMNTVLDDNKKLCLSSGEIIKLTEDMTMMFEVADLAVASPATVSRCGMVYIEPGYIGLDPFVRCWLQKLPPVLQAPNNMEIMKNLFENFMKPGINWMRKNVREYVSTVNGNLVFSLLRFMDTFLEVYIKKEGDPELLTEQVLRLPELLESWFLFSFIWSIGATCDEISREKFSDYLHKQCAKHNVKNPIPKDGLVYDYQLEYGDLTTKFAPGTIDDESIFKDQKIRWVPFLESASEVQITPSFSDIIVPTIDTIRNKILIRRLLSFDKQVLCVGPTGTSKSVVIADTLQTNLPENFTTFSIGFSAKTSSNQTQDLIDSKLDKRRKGVFGPPLGKKMVFFIDDMNMPALETYGAQPPIELIRQYMDHDGWYDRKAIGSFLTLTDIMFIGAMGPPGGGRNPITARFSRHFNTLAFVEMSDESKARIFKSIMVNGWLSGKMSKIQGSHETPEFLVQEDDIIDKLIQKTIDVYNTISEQLRPTPAKSHYTFNLRDLSKVVQGITMHEVSTIPSLAYLMRLWYHENSRIFHDRLINDEDRQWFNNLLKSKIADFDFNADEVIPPGAPIIFGDQLSTADPKPYVFIKNLSDLQRIITEALDDYNAVATAPMRLVLFMDAIRHITRICRIIRQPQGNALLLGMGGSGRQSLSKLAVHVSDYRIFQIELSKNYGVAEWKEDAKSQLMKAGIEGEPLCFLFSDTQIIDESMLEDVNNILNSGDVPNIYKNDELDQIYTAMKQHVGNLPPTKSNLFAAYQKRVKQRF